MGPSKSDAYVIVKVGSIEKHTKTNWNDNHPEWNTVLNLGCVSSGNSMVVKVKDEDTMGGDDLLIKATWPTWPSYQIGQDKTLFDDDHTDDDDGPYFIKIAIVGSDPTHSPTYAPSPSPSRRPTPEPSHYPTPLPTVLGGDPPDWAHSTSKTHKGNTLAIVLPIVLILGAVSMGGALWMWRQGLTRGQTNVFNRYRYKFFASQEGDEETTVYTAPALMSEMTNSASGGSDQEPSSESQYVSLSGAPGSIDDDDEEESTYTL